MRRNHDISCDFNFQVNFSSLQFWRSLILIQIYSNANRSDIVGWNNVLVVYKRNNGTHDPSNMQDACHMNLVIDLAYRGVSWRVAVVFFFLGGGFKQFHVFFFPFYLRGGGKIVAGCVTSYNICFSQYYGGWKSRCIVMKLEITKRTVILSSRKKVRKGSSTQFLLFVSLLQSSFPLTTELEGSLIVFFGTNTFFCFTQKNSFLYGRRGQTGRYQADIHCCI